MPLVLTMATGVPYELNLTAAPQPGGESAIDLTGEKLIGIAIAAAAANTDPITIEPNATNGYDLWLDGGGVQFPPGANCLDYYSVPTHADVGASDRVIDFDGTDGDEITVLLFFGS